MKKSPEKVIKQYSVINLIYTITQVSVYTILPILSIFYLVLEEVNFLKQIIMYTLLIYGGVVLFVMFVLRRCPNCYRSFSKYVFDPKYCPYCNVKLKE